MIYQDQIPQRYQLNRGKIESALNTAFYPGYGPFQNGGMLDVLLFDEGPCIFGWKQKNCLFIGHSIYELKWPGIWFIQKIMKTDFQSWWRAKIINKATASEMSKDDLMDWFENHKKLLED